MFQVGTRRAEPPLGSVSSFFWLGAISLGEYLFTLQNYWSLSCDPPFLWRPTSRLTQILYILKHTLGLNTTPKTISQNPSRSSQHLHSSETATREEQSTSVRRHLPLAHFTGVAGNTMLSRMLPRHTLGHCKGLLTATTPTAARAIADAPAPYLDQYKHLATTPIAARRAFAVLGVPNT